MVAARILNALLALIPREHFKPFICYCAKKVLLFWSSEREKKDRKIKPKYGVGGGSKTISDWRREANYSILRPRFSSKNAAQITMTMPSSSSSLRPGGQPNYFLASCAETLCIDVHCSMCLWFCSFRRDGRASQLQATNERRCLLLPLTGLVLSSVAVPFRRPSNCGTQSAPRPSSQLEPRPCWGTN